MPSNLDINYLFDFPRLRLVPGERRAPWGPELDEFVLDFARRTGLMPTEPVRGYYAAARIGSMCAYIAPDAVDRRRREVFGKSMTWLFVYDDWAEQLGHSLGSADVAHIAETACTWLAEDERDCRRLDLPAARSWRELWEQIRADTSPQWRRRLREEAGAFFWSAMGEADLIRTRTVNTLAEGSDLRFVATAGLVSFTLTEYACGIELTEETVRHPLIARARNVSQAATAWANDIIGLKADLLRGIRNNLVLTMQEEYGGDLDDNVARAADMFHAAAAELAGLDDQFRIGTGLCDGRIAWSPTVSTYLQILQDWVHEGVKWQLRDTNRYRSTVRLTRRQNPNQLLELVRSDRTAR
ncbi:terpene synthase family protein [Nocardia sp. NPDC052566]|uniref:terpene synthase family protein n=1 Tax=Nocardia sp. NPDC052566 TaxID=3364330 RepID=UPI0037CB6DB3